MYRKIVDFTRKFRPFNRRRHARFRPYPAIECVCVYKKSGQQLECVSKIVDISKGGLFIMTSQKKILPDSEVEIRARLPNYKDTIVIHGTIVRTYRRLTRDWYYSGVKFQSDNEEGIRLLLDFVLGES